MNSITPEKEFELPTGAFGWGQKGDPPAGGHEWARNEAVRDLYVAQMAQGWEKATVVNLMPFRLRQQVSSVGEVQVPACPFGVPYATEVIEMFRVDQRELGGQKWSPVAILPVQLAKEVVRKYSSNTNNTRGGVFWFKGDRKPTPEELATAIKGRDVWARHEYEKASSFWAEKHDLTRITSNMRWAAKYLHSSGVLRDLPGWVTVTKQEQLTHNNECEQCGELNGLKAKVCGKCEYPINLEWVSDNRPDLVTKFPRLFVAKSKSTQFQKKVQPQADEQPAPQVDNT